MNEDSSAKFILEELLSLSLMYILDLLACGSASFLPSSLDSLLLKSSSFSPLGTMAVGRTLCC